MSVVQMSDLSSAAVRAHQVACVAAENAHQVSLGVATTQASARAADITHYRACFSSAKASGCSTDTFATALRELGVGQ